MMDRIQLFSTITHSTKKKILKRGVFLAAIGALFWIFGHNFFHFMIGALLMGVGMVPYRKITALEVKPSVITLVEDKGEKTLFYASGRKKILLPVSDIHKISYEDESILVEAKKGKLIFPYFSERSFQRLNSCLQDVVELD